MERERFTSDQVEQVMSRLFAGLSVFQANLCDWLIEADVSQQYLARWRSGPGPVVVSEVRYP